MAAALPDRSGVCEWSREQGFSRVSARQGELVSHRVSLRNGFTYWVNLPCRVSAGHAPLAHCTIHGVEVGVPETESDYFGKLPTGSGSWVLVEEVPSPLDLEVI